MTTGNQDPQKLRQSPRRSGERSMDERKPKTPNQIEGSEGDDENSTAAEQNAEFSHSSIPRSDDDLVTGSGQGGTGSNPKEKSKEGGQASRKAGTSAGERDSAGASGGSSSHSDRNR